MSLLLLLVVLVVLCGVLPIHSYSTGWGYGPSGLLGLILVVLLVLALTGRL